MDLLLPKDGSIIIIDDKYLEAKPILDVLSKNGYPAIYYNGSMDSLPEQGTYLDRVRVVFADIQLVPALDADTYAQMLIEHLNRLISENNGPYVLLVWSGMQNLFADRLEEMIDAPAFTRKPIAFIRLNKADYFRNVNTNTIEIGDVQNVLESRFGGEDLEFILETIQEQFPPKEHKELIPNALQRISRRIRTELRKFKAFELLIAWENMIQKAATDFVAAISSVHVMNEFWDYNFRNVISRFAESQVGQHITELTKKDFISASVKTLNIAFSDSVDKSVPQNMSISNADYESYKNCGYAINADGHIYKIVWRGFQHFELYIDGEKKGDRRRTVHTLHQLVNSAEQKAVLNSMISSYLKLIPDLNTKLHLDFVTRNPIQPGIVYLIKVPRVRKRRFLTETYFNTSFLEKNDENDYKITDEQLNKIKFIELEVSPNCDYAQNKWLKNRVISGIMVSTDLFTALKLKLKDDDSLYKELPNIQYKNETYRVIFSFKLLKAIDLDEIKTRASRILFRIKNEPMADIITRMVSHASRIGLVEFK